MPYSAFSVSLKDESSGNVLPDLYACHNGDFFLVSDFNVVGDEGWVGPVASGDIIVKLSSSTLGAYDARGAS